MSFNEQSGKEQQNKKNNSQQKQKSNQSSEKPEYQPDSYDF